MSVIAAEGRLAAGVGGRVAPQLIDQTRYRAYALQVLPLDPANLAGPDIEDLRDLLERSALSSKLEDAAPAVRNLLGPSNEEVTEQVVYLELEPLAARVIAGVHTQR
jgi:hypothetical protein